MNISARSTPENYAQIVKEKMSSFKTEWRGLKLVSVNQFSREKIQELFIISDIMKRMVLNTGACDLLKGFILSNIFFEPSTRTMCSFESAMYRLGGQVVRVLPGSSSTKKGETLQDTLRCLECYADICAIRHPLKGSVSSAAPYLKKPLLNAGDGVGEHPTQALLDLFTIKAELGRVDNLTIVMLGDLKNGRTVHSLARLLTKYEGIHLICVSPDILNIPDDVKEILETSSSSMKFTEESNLENVLHLADVLYVTRLQKERFSTPEDYEKLQGTFGISKAVLHCGRAKDKMIIMHPLPRVGEIDGDVDFDSRAAYFRQMENGMYVRMALLGLLLLGP